MGNATLNLDEKIKAFRLFLGKGRNLEVLTKFIKLEAKLQPLMAHLQTFPLELKATKLLDYTKSEICQVVQTYQEWKEELDKHKLGKVDVVCIKLTKFQLDLEAWVKEHLTDDDGHAVELTNAIRLFIDKELLGDAPQ